MICLAVLRNSKLVCKAGIVNSSMLTSIVAGGVSGEEPASFHVAGMQDLSQDRSAHVYWLNETPLASGDQLRFTLEESEPSPPIEVKPTDSPEYLAEQQEFEEMEKAFVPPVEQAVKRWPALELKLTLRAERTVSARVPLGQEHIMCSLLWTKWHPECCRVYVRSFTGFAAGTEARTTEWLRGALGVGESFELLVYA